MNIENNKIVINKEEYNSLLNLKEENGSLQNQMIQLIKQNENLIKENEKLRNKLRKFINENTPSGALPWYIQQYQSTATVDIDIKEDKDKRKTDTDDKQKKTNIRNNRSNKIDEIVNLNIKKCPHCGFKLNQKNKKSKRIIVSLNLKNPVKTTEYTLNHAYCPNCKRELRPAVPNSLPYSKYSLDIFLMISILSVALNLTDRKISEFFFSIFKLGISPATVCNMRLKLKNYLGNEYNLLEEKICESSVSHMDETGLK